MIKKLAALALALLARLEGMLEDTAQSSEV